MDSYSNFDYGCVPVDDYCDYRYADYGYRSAVTATTTTTTTTAESSLCSRYCGVQTVAELARSSQDAASFGCVTTKTHNSFQWTSSAASRQKKVINFKEQRRTQTINNAFADLRDCIPSIPADTKLSKIKTLKLAKLYIEYLLDILDQNQTVQCVPEMSRVCYSYSYQQNTSGAAAGVATTTAAAYDTIGWLPTGANPSKDFSFDE